MVKISIKALEVILAQARAAHAADPVGMNDVVEIEVVQMAPAHGQSDRVNASLQYGWSECGSERIFQQ